MKITKQLSIKIFITALVLSATFALGYGIGYKTVKPSIDTVKVFTTMDMGRAFGNSKPADHVTTTQQPNEMSLGGLVAGLERKVAANPDNIDQQLLLAQTYSELDNRAKSIKLLRALNKQAPKNAYVKMTFATILMKSNDRQELKEASLLLGEVIKLKPDSANMAGMYQSEIKAKLSNLTK